MYKKAILHAYISENYLKGGTNISITESQTIQEEVFN